MRFLRLLGWKSSAEVLTRLLGLILLWVLARKFGTAGLGHYALSLALFGLWSIALDWGTHSLITREVARNTAWAGDWYQAGLKVKLISTGVYLLGALCLPWLYPAAPGRLFLFGGCTLILGQSWLDYSVAYLNGKLAFQSEFRLRTTFRMLVSGSQLGVFFLQQPLGIVLATGGVMSVLGAWGSQLYLWQQSQAHASDIHKQESAPPPHYLSLMRQGWGFWLANVSWMVLLKLDLIMLPQWGGSLSDLGQYQVAYRLYEMLGIGAGLISLTAFPLLAAENFSKKQSQVWLGRSLLLGMALAVPGICLAPWLIPLIFGVEFQGSAQLVQILYLGGPMLYFNLMAFSVLGAQDKQHWVGASTALSLALNAILNMYLIPLYQAQGAALASLMADILLFLSLLFLGRDFLVLPNRILGLLTLWTVAAMCLLGISFF